jgi:hypothetical protein
MIYFLTPAIGQARRTPKALRAMLFLYGLLLGLAATGLDASSLPDSVLSCVPCHQQGDRNQVDEWLASPYSEREGGRGCIDCHSKRCPAAGGTDSVEEQVSGTDLQGLREAVRLSVTTVCSIDAVEAEVVVSNIGVGHLLPTGSSERTLILEVAAHDHNGAPLPLRAGSRYPLDTSAPGTVGSRRFVADPPPGDAAVFRPRLAPFATDVSRFRFGLPASGPAYVSTRLVLVQTTGPPLEIASTASVCGMSVAKGAWQ